MLCWLSTNGCSLILFYFILLAHQSTEGARARESQFETPLKVSNFFILFGFFCGLLFSVKFYAIHVSRFPCFPLEWAARNPRPLLIIVVIIWENLFISRSPG